MTTPSPARLLELAAENNDPHRGSYSPAQRQDLMDMAYACRFTAAALEAVGKVSGERAAELLTIYGEDIEAIRDGCFARQFDQDSTIETEATIALIHEALASRATIAEAKAEIDACTESLSAIHALMVGQPPNKLELQVSAALAAKDRRIAELEAGKTVHGVTLLAQSFDYGDELGFCVVVGGIRYGVRVAGNAPEDVARGLHGLANSIDQALAGKAPT